MCPGYIHTEFHLEIEASGFDKSRVPEEFWMQPQEVVRISLDALGSGKVLVVPGQGNQTLAASGLQQQLDLL